MKNIKLFTIVALLIVMGSSALFAQEIGHINSQALLESLPEKQKADADIKALLERHQAEIKKKEEALKSMYESTMKELQGKSEAELKAMEAQINAKQAQFQKDQQALAAYQEAASKEVNEKSDALYNPINQKVQTAINEVAAQKGIKYVIDSSLLLYSNGGYNLMNDVKAKLGTK